MIAHRRALRLPARRLTGDCRFPGRGCSGHCPGNPSRPVARTHVLARGRGQGTACEAEWSFTLGQLSTMRYGDICATAHPIRPMEKHAGPATCSGGGIIRRSAGQKTRLSKTDFGSGLPFVRRIFGGTHNGWASALDRRSRSEKTKRGGGSRPHPSWNLEPRFSRPISSPWPRSA